MEYDKIVFFLKQPQTQTCARYTIVASLYRILGTKKLFIEDNFQNIVYPHNFLITSKTGLEVVTNAIRTPE